MSQLRSSARLWFILILLLVACNPVSKPAVVISNPPSGSQFREGEDVPVQTTAIDKTGVVRVELVVDNNILRVDPSPTAQGQQIMSLVQTWKAEVGEHTILVRAYNAAGAVSDPVAVSIKVVAKDAPTATSAPKSATLISSTPTTCSDNYSFVADVTVPDGISLAAGQSFNKIWRVNNTGTCTWGAGYQLVFTGGEAMSKTTFVAVPSTPPGTTADLLVAMTAPSAPGAHSGFWRLKNPGGGLFGTQVSVKINVPGVVQPTKTPTPAGCAGSPNIESFTASSTNLAAPGNVTLAWGSVTNADSVEIDNDIGGVATPGSTTIALSKSTTFTLTAHCGSTTKTAQLTVTVAPQAKVTSVNASGIPDNAAVTTCPRPFTFNGDITTDGKATVSYIWEDSTGYSSSSADLTFSGAGTQSVPALKRSINITGTIKLHVRAPNDIVSSDVSFICK